MVYLRFMTLPDSDMIIPRIVVFVHSIRAFTPFSGKASGQAAFRIPVPESIFIALGQYRIILSAILRSQIFRQTQQKAELILYVLASIFVKYDGKDASKIALKRLRVNCAVLP